MIMSDEQFEALYEYLNSEPTCNHTLKYTVDWLMEHHVQDSKANIEKIVDLGGHCDCEVLMNVTPDIWEERRDEQITGPIIMGESEWQQFLSELLADSGMEERQGFLLNAACLSPPKADVPFPIIQDSLG